MSSYSPQDLEDKIKANLTNVTFIEVQDDSDGCGGKFSCIIVSNDFKGKPLLARHRMINTILSEELKTIHAFSQKTLTPEQYNK